MNEPWAERSHARRALLRGLAWGLGLIVLGLAAWWFLREPAEPTGGPAALVGRPAPDFTLYTPQGEAIRLRDLQGRAVVLNLWATWCEPCKTEMPLLQRLAATHPRVVVLGVNYGEDAARVQAFAQEYGLTFPLLLDPDHEVAQAYRARGLPTTVFIDPQGVVQQVHLGVLTEDDIRAALRALGVKP